MENAWVSPSIFHSMRKSSKPHRKEPVIIKHILFPKYGYFFSIRFLTYSILYHMENARGFPSISHSIGKCSKTHRVGRTWKIGTHTFPKERAVLYHQIPILWYALSHGTCMAFSINFT